MVRQYIGARYVPKFADPIEWNKNNSYESLTIVTYLNNSYTSKKAVPVGIEITNGEYWVATGNYNAQIEEYRETTVKLSEQVGELTGAVKTNTDDISELTEKVNALGNDNRKIIFIGDSYGVTTAASKWWCEWCAEYLGVDSGNWVKNCVGGAGFTGGSDGSLKTFLSELQEEASAFNKDEVTDIIVCGGFNDRTDGDNSTQIINAINTFCSYARTTFKNATISIGMIGWSANSTYIYDLKKVLTDYVSGCTQNAKTRYLNGVENVMHVSSNFYTDGVHPNDAGEKELGRAISNAIKTGSCTYSSHMNIALMNPPAGGTGHGNYNLYESQDNGICLVSSPSMFYVTFTTEQSIVPDGSNEIVCAKLGGTSIVHGMKNVHTGCCVPITLTLDSTSTQLNAYLYIEDDAMHIVPFARGLSAIKYKVIFIPPFSFTANVNMC